MDKRYFVYIITNLINGKIYIGKTNRSLKQRWAAHCSPNRKALKEMIIPNAIKKYGKENFKIELLEECISEKEMEQRESFWILAKESHRVDIGYNIKTESDECQVYNESSCIARSKLSRNRLAKNNKNKLGIGVKLEKNRFVALCSFKKIKYRFLAENQLDAQIHSDKIALYLHGRETIINFPEKAFIYTNAELKIAFEKFKQEIPKSKESVYYGVNPACNKWAAFLKIAGERYFLGFYEKEYDAAIAVDKARFIFKEKNSVFYNFSNLITNYDKEELAKFLNVNWYKVQRIMAGNKTYENNTFEFV